MGEFIPLLRRLVLLVVIASILLLLMRYLLDIAPSANPDLLSFGLWVRQMTNPVLSLASAMFGVPVQPGLWNPLPLGLAIGLMLVGTLAINVLDRFEPKRARTDLGRVSENLPSPVSAQTDAALNLTSPGPALATSLNTNPVLATIFNANSPALNAPAMAARPERIGRYEIQDELGRGAMGVVYKARDPQIGRTVAIKTILNALGNDPTAEDYKKRFFAEARAAGRLNHPGIMKVHDLIEDASGRPCLVLEFIHGQTLDKLAAAGPLPLARSLDILIQASRALAYAHVNGVIHRDIKPANLMVADDGHTTISDFGIAKIEDTLMTAAGTIMGTPAFMSPEQISGVTVDHGTDIFSLGSVLYWLCTGQRPFAGDTFTTISYKVMHTAPESILRVNARLPAALGPVVERCLAKTPQERYPSAYNLAADLEAIRAALMSESSRVA